MGRALVVKLNTSSQARWNDPGAHTGNIYCTVGIPSTLSTPTYFTKIPHSTCNLHWSYVHHPRSPPYAPHVIYGALQSLLDRMADHMVSGTSLLLYPTPMLQAGKLIARGSLWQSESLVRSTHVPWLCVGHAVKERALSKMGAQARMPCSVVCG